MATTVAFWLSCFAPLLFRSAAACIYPTGVTELQNLGTVDLNLLPDNFILFGLAEAGSATLLDYETPIQFRNLEYAIIPVYSAMAAFEPLALDHFGRVDLSNQRRRCSDATDFNLQRKITLAYSTYFAWLSLFPGSAGPLQGVLQAFGLDPNVCDSLDCTDENTPYGLASVLVQEMRQYSQFDGWNEDGSYNREFNRIPFEDFRENRYIPQNSPWELTNIDKWQPLRESDELGFLYFQEHVTPHIGFTGKSIFFTDEQICSYQAAEPSYDYSVEIPLAIERTRNLTDETKMEVEIFDNKISLIILLAQYYSRLGVSVDSFDFIVIDTIINAAIYEATLVVWKEKINFDAVRPPSIIQALLDDQLVTSYAGTSPEGEPFGTQTFRARDWEPYIRTMPHAEYPSASSCVCAAFRNAVVAFTGSDDVIGALGAPLFDQRLAGSSFQEPGFTPSTNLTFAFGSWSQIADRCGISRINGGMHFTDAVPNGADLCADIGDVVYDAFQKLVNGEVPDYIVDPEDQTIPDRDCAAPRCSDNVCSPSAGCLKCKKFGGCKKCKRGYRKRWDKECRVHRCEKK